MKLAARNEGCFCLLGFFFAEEEFSFICIIASDSICQVLIVTDQTSRLLLGVQRDLIRSQG